MNSGTVANIYQLTPGVVKVVVELYAPLSNGCGSSPERQFVQVELRYFDAIGIGIGCLIEWENGDMVYWTSYNGISRNIPIKTVNTPVPIVSRSFEE